MNKFDNMLMLIMLFIVSLIAFASVLFLASFPFFISLVFNEPVILWLYFITVPISVVLFIYLYFVLRS